MKHARNFMNVMRRWYRPSEHTSQVRQRTLRQALTLTRRTVITLEGVVRLIHAGYRCPDVQCEGHRRAYRSAEADALALPCYDRQDFPRTNKELERSIRALKTQYRRISGRKNWNSYLLRYERYVVSPPSRQFQYASVDEAAESLLEQLILPNDEQTRDELRGVLGQWLVQQDGVLIPPAAEKMVSAIMWWRKRSWQHITKTVLACIEESA